MKIKVKIRNEKEYKKFIKMLPLYRLPIFKLFKFTLENNYKDVEIIVKALNIKTRKKRITFVYDETVKIIDNYYSCKNLCDFKEKVCILHRESGKMYKGGCCRKCIYNNNGCTTKNVACKMFYCFSIKEKNKILDYKDLNLLKTLGIISRIIIKSDYFTKREAVIIDAYLGIFSVPIIIIRNIVNAIRFSLRRM